MLLKNLQIFLQLTSNVYFKLFDPRFKDSPRGTLPDVWVEKIIMVEITNFINFEDAYVWQPSIAELDSTIGVCSLIYNNKILRGSV